MATPSLADVLNFTTATLTFLGIPALIAGGILAVIGVFSNQRKKLEKDGRNDADRLIRLLKDQVDALERKVSDQDILINENGKKIDTLIVENQILREVLQGKDALTKEYQQEAMRTFKTADKVLDVVNNMDQKIEKLLYSSTVK